MARPIRIEFPGALYHVTSRGNRQEAIYQDTRDRTDFCTLLGEVVTQFKWLCHGYCLMDNHYHLIIETPEGNLGKGMRQLNGVYTQLHNRRYGRVGHLFQGRYSAIVVDRDSYLLELVRYVVLNPVRAGMVSNPEAWPWSSYRAMVGVVSSPPWLTADGVLVQFAPNREQAHRRFAGFVADGIGKEGPWRALHGQTYLGDVDFVERVQEHVEARVRADIQIPEVQRRVPARPLVEIAKEELTREAAIVAAYTTGAYSYQEIAEYFGIHFTTVGRIVRKARGRQGLTEGRARN